MLNFMVLGKLTRLCEQSYSQNLGESWCASSTTDRNYKHSYSGGGRGGRFFVSYTHHRIHSMSEFKI